MRHKKLKKESLLSYFIILEREWFTIYDKVLCYAVGKKFSAGSK